MNTYTGATASTMPGYLLAQTYRMLRHAMDDVLHESNLTTPQWAALACMAKNVGISGAELARIHHVTPQTMNTVLQNLEQNGMIVREPHPTQGTVLRVLLSAEGRERLAEATRRVESVHRLMLSELCEPEQDTLLTLLKRCMAALESGGLARLEGPTCVD